ncbi:MAG: hypothetical protein ACLFTA_00950 [Candidatus Nanohaloarchaea archaeon]
MADLSFLLQFLEISVLVSIVAGVGGFVFQKSFQYFLDKNIEQVRNENRKDEIEFTEFKQRQIKSLEELYERLVLCYQEMYSLTRPYQDVKEPDKEEKLQSAAEALNEFRRYYERKRIYLPNEMDQKLDDFHSELKSNFTSFKNLVLRQEGIRDSEVQKKKVDKHDEIWEKIDKDVSEMKEEIRDKIKQIMRSKEPQI